MNRRLIFRDGSNGSGKNVALCTESDLNLGHRTQSIGCIACSLLERNGTAMRDIIVIGASSGGMEAICDLLRDLPSNLPASIFVVQHVGATSVLEKIFGRCGSLQTVAPTNGEKI